MQKDRRACRFAGNHQWHGHDGASAQLGNQQGAVGIEIIHIHRFATAYGLEHHFLIGFWPKAAEAVGE